MKMYLNNKNVEYSFWRLMRPSWLGVIFFMIFCSMIACRQTYHIPENIILGTWCLGSTGVVTHNGNDVTTTYPNLCINFTRTSFDGPFLYTAVSATPIFNKSGTAQWMGTTLKQITIDAGDLIINIEEVNVENLVMSFSLTEKYLAEHGGDATSAGEYRIKLESVKL